MLKYGDDLAFYSCEETAALLGVCLRTLQRWVAGDSPWPPPLAELKPLTAPNGKTLFNAKEVHRAVSTTLRIEFTSEVAERFLARNVETKKRPKANPT
ncbi:MAG TPA: hypothetical protein VMT99_00515 [Candidatus Paceibacterota bacterium]|nr:hypothetical protein [Candidatus Paceibacterota bacterium]